MAILLIAAGTGCGSNLPRPKFERFDFTVTPGPEDHPDVPAVVLLDRGDLQLTVDPERRTPLCRLRRLRRVKILRENGLDQARVEVAYNPGSAVHGLIARAVLPSGEIVEADTDGIVDTSHADGRRAKALHVPEATVGAVIEYTYDLYIDDPRFIEPWVFQSKIPTVRSELAIVAPPGFNIDLRYSKDGAFIERAPERFETEEGIRFFWSVSNLPARFLEPNMPDSDLLSDRAHVIYASARYSGRELPGFASWDDVGDWFLRRVPNWTELSDATIGEAKRVAGDVSMEEKALKLLEVVAKDLAWDHGPLQPLWRARLPHPDTVLQQKRGNRTSRGLLLTALLKAVGIKAVPALVAYRDQDVLLPDAPTVTALDGVVALIPRSTGPLILDPSQLTVSADVPSPRLQSTRIIAIRGGTTEVLLVPKSAPQDSQTEVRYDLKLDQRGDVFGSIEARFTGAEAGVLRARLFDADPEQYAATVADFVQGRGGAMPLESVHIADLRALRRPLTLKGKVTPQKLLSGEGTDTYVPIGRIIGSATAEPREVRRTPLTLSAPRQASIVVTLMLPEDHTYEVATPISEAWSGEQVDLKMRKETSRRLGLSRKSVRTALDVPANSYPEYRRFLQGLRGAEQQAFLIRRPAQRPTEY